MIKIYTLLLMLIIISLSYSKNDSPIISSLSFQYNNTNNTGNVIFSLLDKENETCSLFVEYSIDNKISWVKTKNLSKQLFQANMGKDTVVWNIHEEQLPYANYSECYIRVSAHDGHSFGEKQLSNRFILSIFSSKIFDENIPIGKIHTVASNTFHTLSKNCDITFSIQSNTSTNKKITLEYLSMANPKWKKITSKNLPILTRDNSMHTVTWEVGSDFTEKTLHNIYVRMVIEDESNNILNIIDYPNALYLDLEPPNFTKAFYYNNPQNDSNALIIQLPFDVDEQSALDINNYAIDYGRKIKKIHKIPPQSSQRNNTSLLELIFNARALNMSPDDTGALEVNFVNLSGEWEKKYSIPVNTLDTSFTTFSYTITQSSLLHARTKFYIRNSSTTHDIEIDNVTFKQHRDVLLQDDFSNGIISYTKWDKLQNASVTNGTLNLLKSNNLLESNCQSFTYNLKDKTSFRYIAELDQPLLSNVLHTVTINNLKDNFGNTQTLPCSTKVIQRSDIFIPSIHVKHIYKDLIGSDYTVYFQLSDQDKNILTIDNIEYRALGTDKWYKSFPLSNISNLSPNNYSGSYRISLDSIPEHSSFELKQHVYEEKNFMRHEGSMSTFTYYRGDGITSSDLYLTKADETDSTVSFDIKIDGKKSTTDFFIQYSHVGSHGNRYPATVSGTLNNIDSSMAYKTSFTWNKKKDILDKFSSPIKGDIDLHINGYNYDGVLHQQLRIPINSFTEVDLTFSLPDTVRDSVIIPYTIVNPSDSQPVDLICDYFAFGEWKRATINKSLLQIKPSDYIGNFTWYTNLDLPQEHSNQIYFRIYPKKEITQSPVQSQILVVDNNSKPTVSVSYQNVNTHFNTVHATLKINDFDKDKILVKPYIKPYNSIFYHNARLSNLTLNYEDYHNKELSVKILLDNNIDLGSYSNALKIQFRVYDLRETSAPKDSAITVTKELYFTNLDPVIRKIDIPEKIKLDTIPISLHLDHHSSDSMNIIGEYRMRNQIFWKPMSISGNLNIASKQQTDTISFKWNSKKDIHVTNGTNQLQVRFITSNHSQDTLVSSFLIVDTNTIPQIKISDKIYADKDQITMNVSLYDKNHDELSLQVYMMKYDSNTATWTMPEILDITPSGVHPNQYLNGDIPVKFGFDSIIPPTYSDSIKLKVYASDGFETQTQVKSFFFSRQGPHVTLKFDHKKKFSDTITLPIEVSYGGRDSIQLVVQLVDDAGIVKNAEILNSQRFFQESDVTIVNLQWDSQKNLPQKDISAQKIRIIIITPFNRKTINDVIRINNNHEPILSFSQSTKNEFTKKHKKPPFNLSFRVNDPEKDTIRLKAFLLYSSGSTFFPTPVKIIGDTILSKKEYDEKKLSIELKTFNYYGDKAPVKLVLTPLDNDRGEGDTLNFNYTNILGDFNSDGLITTSDFDIFLKAWHEKDYRYNIAPIENTIPNVKTMQDSLFNLKDLAALIISYNYFKTNRKNFLKDKSDIDHYPSLTNNDIVTLQQRENTITFQVTPDENMVSTSYLFSFPSHLLIDSISTKNGKFSYQSVGKNHGIVYYPGLMGNEQKTIQFHLSNLKYHKNIHLIVKKKTVSLTGETIVMSSKHHLTESTENHNQLELGVLENPLVKNGNLVRSTFFLKNSNRNITAVSVSLYDPLGNKIFKNVPLQKVGNLYEKKLSFTIKGNGTYICQFLIRETNGKQRTHNYFLGVGK